MKTRANDERAEWLLPSAAAREMGVSAAAIRQWIQSGRLPALRLSNNYRVVSREALRAFADVRAAQRVRHDEDDIDGDL